MTNCINLIIEMSPRFVLRRENVPCVAEVVNRSLKADCTDFTQNPVTVLKTLLCFVKYITKYIHIYIYIGCPKISDRVSS